MHHEAQHDPVERPRHYNNGSVECIDAIRAALGDEGFQAYCQGNVLKYLWRHKYKGKPVEDLHKCSWYLQRLIETIEKEEDI
tara:strand:+ start:1312 stop:1557 length:246 start_codon:yes stop_codon:yes gene_type:complete